MASSSEGERAAAVSGEVLDYLDYPCTERLRLRRLVACFSDYRFIDIYRLVRNKMGVIFHAWDLAKQVKDGLLRDAYYCVRSFAPHHDSSDEATLLANFLLQLMGIYGYFAGGNGNNPCAASVVCDWFIELYEKPVLAKYPCLATVVDDVLFLRPHRVKASVDWSLFLNKAASMVEEMSYKIPELRARMEYPRGQNHLYNVVAVRSSSLAASFRQRRSAKNSHHKQATDIARLFLQLKKRLPSSDLMEGSGSFSDLTLEQLDAQIALLLEEALQAGWHPVMKPGHRHPPAHLPKEAFPLKAFLNRGTMSASMEIPLPRQGHRPEHSSKLGMKRSSFQEADQDSPLPGNDSKRPRITRTASYDDTNTTTSTDPAHNFIAGRQQNQTLVEQGKRKVKPMLGVDAVTGEASWLADSSFSVAMLL
ncbi:hypothetical protein U9M48_010695 [Paspalum notatum var. saurae]|uniref:Uncharacterized protein n=1 Tax=Paspalum notatum var. saurae TaxID=547442 RepID=A0AAQ3SU56_PASNO